MNRSLELREALLEALNEQSTRSNHSWLTRSEVIDAVLAVIEANTVVVVHSIECPHDSHQEAV